MFFKKIKSKLIWMRAVVYVQPIFFLTQYPSYKISLTVSQSKVMHERRKSWYSKKKNISIIFLFLNSSTFWSDLWCSRAWSSTGSCSFHSFLFNWLGCFRNFFFFNFFLFLLYCFLRFNILEFTLHQFTIFLSGKDKVHLFIGEWNCLVFILEKRSKSFMKNKNTINFWFQFTNQFLEIVQACQVIPNTFGCHFFVEIHRQLFYNAGHLKVFTDSCENIIV